MSNFSNREVKNRTVQSDYQATGKFILPPQQTDPAPLYHLCLVSVWAGTRPLPPLHVWSPHRSDFAPLGEASSPAFWGSSEHPGHHPRARRDTAHTSCCSLRERQCEGYVKRPWLCKEDEDSGHLLQSSISGSADGFLFSFPNSFLEFLSCLKWTCTFTHCINTPSDTVCSKALIIYVSTGFLHKSKAKHKP